MQLIDRKTTNKSKNTRSVELQSHQLLYPTLSSYINSKSLLHQSEIVASGGCSRCYDCGGFIPSPYDRIRCATCGHSWQDHNY